MSIALGRMGREPRAVVSSPEPVWHESAPRAVRKAYLAGHDSDGWKAWQQHLRTRKLMPANEWGRRFGLPPSDINDMRVSEAATTLRQWLLDAEMGQLSAEYAASALAWCHRLPQLSAKLHADEWWQLLDHLLHAVAEADETFVIDGASADRAGPSNACR